MIALRRFTVLAAVAAAAVFSVPLQAAELTEADYARVNAALVQRYVLPRVEALAGATAELDRAVPGFCAAPSRGGLDTVTRSYAVANDAWMRIRHLAFGPLEFFMRVNRFQFSPDPRGRVAKDLAAALTEGDDALLVPDAFSRAPVTLQGFSALERLLFGDQPRAALLAGDDAAAYRCRLASAVAQNLAEMAKGVAADWKGGGSGAPFIAVITRPGGDNPYYATHADATLQLFNSLYGGLQVIADVKLGPPLGTSREAARPELVESEPSGASLANILASLESLAALYFGSEGKDGLQSLLERSGDDAPLVPLLRRAFDMTLATASGIGTPLAEAVPDPAARPEVEKLHLQVRALKQLIVQRLAAAIGVAVGFNALDGD